MATSISGNLLVPGFVAGDDFRSIIRSSTIDGLTTLMNNENIDMSSVIKIIYDDVEKSFTAIFHN